MSQRTAPASLSRRDFLALGAATAGVAGLAALGLTGLTAPAVAVAADGSKTFTYAIAGDPGSNVNPVTTSDRFGLMTLKLLYNPLWAYRSDGIHYFLAESFDESDDHLTITAHLRQGVTWSDGEPFTADDVVFTYETIANDETADSYSTLNYGDQGKVEVKKVDDHTVEFTFPFLNADAPEMLAGIDGVWIFPKHVYEGVTDWENNDKNANPVGTGAFTLEEYQAGSYLRFKAREDYFGGKPGVDEVVYQIITNENTGMQAIQTGEVNAWIGTPAEVQQMSIEANGLTVTPYSEGRIAYFMFNVDNVPDERVRKAVLYSLDKKAIADAALLSSDYYDLPYTFLPVESEFFTTDGVEKYDRDVDKAKQLLQEAGQPNPSFTFTYSAGDSLQETAAVMIQEQAAEAGITITPQGMDSSALYAEYKKKENDLQIFLGGYIMGIDPDTFATLFRSEGESNYMHYDYPDIDELFAQGRQETDTAKRKDIYAQVQAKIQDTGAFYPLYSNKRLLVTTKNVGGIDDAKLIPIYTFEEINKLTVE